MARAKKPKKSSTIINRLGIRKTPDAKPKTQRQARTKGKRSGLGITDFWATLFKANEELPRKKKMTDEEIKRQVIEEFPDRKAVKKLGAVGEKGAVTVNYYRILFNRGRLTYGEIPDPKSRRYSSEGQVVSPRTGKPLREGQKECP